MRAVFLEGPKTLVEREADTPVVENNEVLIRVRNMGICGSDINIKRGST